MLIKWVGRDFSEMSRLCPFLLYNRPYMDGSSFSTLEPNEEAPAPLSRSSLSTAALSDSTSTHQKVG